MNRQLVFTGLLAMILIISASWLTGQGQQAGRALACCYDPPEPVIVPDAPTVSESAEPEATEQSITQSTVLAEDSNDIEEKHSEDGPRFRPFERPIGHARAAIARDEWFKALMIVEDAIEGLGSQSDLVELAEEINAHFELEARIQTELQQARTNLQGALQPLEETNNPLSKLLQAF